MLRTARRTLSRRTALTAAAGTAVALSVTVAGAMSAQGAAESPAQKQAPQKSAAQQPAAQGAQQGGGWQSVGSGMTSGVSGIVVTGQEGGTTHALIVRDNKKPGENRMAAVTYEDGSKPQVKPLKWEGGTPPVDLEAIDAVPGKPGEYIAVASEGRGYRVTVSGDTVHAHGSFALPGLAKGDNIENFALTSQGGGLAAVWGHRGGDGKPATLYAAPLSFDAHGAPRFGDVTHRALRAPYPTQPAKDVRHASDLKISKSGDLLVSSATDPGDDGPFDSGVYDAGKITLNGGKAALHTSAEPKPAGKFGGHKIEALACLPGSDGEGIVGTDDENGGGALRTAEICG